ncbi:MAG TPA: hypothetical protein VIQ31_23045 [Phormidium sp.]
MVNEAEKSHSNAEEIYKYTEKEVEGFNKSLDALTSKLISTLGFSGIFLKFVTDLAADEKHPFWIILISSLALALGVGCCIAGLYARDAGCIIRARTLDDAWWYNATEEEYRFRIIRQWYTHIDNLENVLDIRRSCLNLALLLIAFVAVLFAINNVLVGIHYPQVSSK